MTSKQWLFLGLGAALLTLFGVSQMALLSKGEMAFSPAPIDAPSTNPPTAGSSTAGSYVSGEIAFDPPSQMYVNQPEVVEVRIGQKITEEMRKELLRVPQVKTIGIPANGRDKMRAELKASNLDFGIDYQGSGSLEKIVTKDESAYWSWNVTPKRVGQNRQLTLIASILLTDKKGNLVKGSDGKPIAKDTPFHRQINIDVDPSAVPSPISSVPDSSSAASPASATVPNSAGGNGVGPGVISSNQNKEKPASAKDKSFIERVLEEPLKAMLMILLPAIGVALASWLPKKPGRKRNTKPKEKPPPPQV